MFHRCDEVCFSIQTDSKRVQQKSFSSLYGAQQWFFPKYHVTNDHPHQSLAGWMAGRGGEGRGIWFWKAPQRQSLNNHVSSAGLHYPPVRQAECQPGLLAGCGKVNGGGKTSYCVTLERNGEGRPSVSSGLPYPQSKWTRAARGEATDTHRAKPSEHNTEAWGMIQPKRWALMPIKHIYICTHIKKIRLYPRNLAAPRVYVYACFFELQHTIGLPLF